eukprot:480066_1
MALNTILWLTMYISLPFLSASGSRLTTKGSNILWPNKTVAYLQGFNMLWDQRFDITENDPSLMKSLLPKANIARLVMVHWADGNRTNPMTNKPYIDCKNNNASSGYLKQQCINEFDKRLNLMKQNNIWSIVTFRGEDAAGGGYPSQSDVFHNKTERKQFISMWKFLTQRYINQDMIAAFEIMSEPRTNLPLTDVVNLYEETCYEIQKIDPNMICLIGPSEYYNICNLNATMIINSTQVIYTFDFFVPYDYVNAIKVNNEIITYPGIMPCCQIAPKSPCVPDWCSKSECNKNVTINKEWISKALNVGIKLRETNNIPILINQCRLHYNTPNRLSYVNDIVSLMQQKNIHWTYWQWRNYKLDCDGLIHNLSNGSVVTDMQQIQVLQQYLG